MSIAELIRREVINAMAEYMTMHDYYPATYGARVGVWW